MLLKQYTGKFPFLKHSENGFCKKLVSKILKFAFIINMYFIMRKKEIKQRACQNAEEYGIDLTLIDENLKKTPTERLLALQDLVNFMQTLKKSGKEYYAKLRKNN
ncbi:MAG: hypothetical protein ABIA04_12305 [Pseudomonadota bacterium]